MIDGKLKVLSDGGGEGLTPGICEGGVIGCPARFTGSTVCCPDGNMLVGDPIQNNIVVYNLNSGYIL